MDINSPTESKDDPTQSLDADQLVDNGVPLPSDVPDPKQVELHRDIEHGLQQQHGVHHIVADETRYVMLVLIWA